MRPTKKTLRAPLVCLALVLVVLGSTPGVAESEDPEEPAESDEGESDTPSSPGMRPVIEERVEVTATRLAGTSDSEDRVPAHVTIVDREQIRSSGALTIQDLLMESTGVIVYDQVGNYVQKVFDLRGFTSGTGTKIFLDGAPVNDPRNNTTPLDLMPVGALERVEIIRGSTAALAGGGSEAGVIHLRTARSDRPFGGALALAGGNFGTSRFAGNLGGTVGEFDYTVSGSRFDTDGFRRNAGGDLSWLSGNLGLELHGGRRLELAILDSESELGSPGSLTLDEFEENPRQSLNPDDFFHQNTTQASLNFMGRLAGRFTASANLFYRQQGSDSFTRGRSESELSLTTEAPAYGSTVQVTHSLESNRVKNQLSFGVEWLEGETDASGISFFPGFDRSPIANTTDSRTLAWFAQDRVTLSPQWSLEVGLRGDDDRVGYIDTADSGLPESSSYSEISFRAGANWNPSQRYGLYASYGEAFLPPTVEQLFAFPLFGSNPDLRPQDSSTYELGFRARWSRTLRLDASVFLIDTTDEIVFIPDPETFGGENENFGETRRSGVEASFRGRPIRTFELFANVTVLDAEFRNGPDAGNEVPLVPRERFALGFDWDLPAGFALRADGLFVGSQFLTGDEANAAPRLPSYKVLNSRLSWSASSLGGSRTVDGLILFVEGQNLLDRKYATRGILSFDTIFVTPAPDRRFLAGAKWEF